MAIVAQMKAPLWRLHVSLLADLRTKSKIHRVKCLVTTCNFAQEEIDAPELIIFAAAVSVSARLCVCLLRPAGLPVLLAAPLTRRGLVEVADQGSAPGSVAEG